MTHDLWAGLNKHIHAYLAQISLEQLIHAKRDTPVVLHDRRERRETAAAD
jgi:DNA-binding IscR family transcriptional regulator